LYFQREDQTIQFLNVTVDTWVDKYFNYLENYIMVSTANVIQDRTYSDLYSLRYEVEEAFLNKDSYLAREQVIRFESICQHFQGQLSLSSRYSRAIEELKLLIFRQRDYPFVQKRLLEEIRRFILDVHYLAM